MNKSLIYIIRRLGFYLIAAFAALTLNFVIPRLMPGDPASIIFARFKGKMNPEAINAMRQSFGLTNDPIYIQYLSYLKGIFSGDIDRFTSLTSSPAAPGSSGSVVLSMNNEVYGVLFAVHPAFPVASVITSHDATKDFLKETEELLKDYSGIGWYFT